MAKAKSAFFQFPKPRKSASTDLPLNRVKPNPVRPSEGFTKQIQGLKASDLEERFARGLDKRKLGYEFRKPYFGGRGTSSEVELDFLVSDGGVSYAFQIDGAFAHASSQQKSHDMIQDARLNQELQKQGIGPVKRIPAWQLDTQSNTDNLLRTLI